MSQFMKSNQLISIIMTCFNGEQYLRESISSIMSQTYKEWEIIFIDNNSNDKSREIILSYDDDRIKYFQLNETLNLGSVRSFALSKCFGHFINYVFTHTHASIKAGISSYRLSWFSVNLIASINVWSKLCGCPTRDPELFLPLRCIPIRIRVST